MNEIKEKTEQLEKLKQELKDKNVKDNLDKEINELEVKLKPESWFDKIIKWGNQK